MRLLAELFKNNREWASRMEREHPGFFARLVGQQTPEFLWIGCSDSRVPANEIVGLMPGEIFVHRNVANLVDPGDRNCLAVIQYAVADLRVRHIMVVGHYGCGGVRAALGDPQPGIVHEWLAPVRALRERHSEFLGSKPSEGARWGKLCELNVLEQARNVALTPPVLEAWNRGQPLAVHGWIYSLADGHLRDLGVTASSASEAAAAFDDGVRKILS